MEDAFSAEAALSCDISSIVNLKENTFDSETGSFDLTDCGLEFIFCLGTSLVSVGLPHGDVVGFKNATTEGELALMSAFESASPCPSPSKRASSGFNQSRPKETLNIKDCMCMCMAVHMVFGVSVAVGCVVPPFADVGDFWIAVVVKANIVV